MKNVLLILFFIALPLSGFAQSNTVAVTTPTEITTEVVTPKTTTTKSSTLSSAFKAKLNKLNHKKSNEIISIKAFRKSLKIKVKTVKLC